MEMDLTVEQFRDLRPYVKGITFNGLEGSEISFTIKLSDLGLKINKDTKGKLAEKICNAVYSIYIEEE